MSNDTFEVPKALSGTGSWLDDRFHGARGLRVFMRKIFPDHWSFMLGEIALWSFVILLLTGTFLAFFFQPSMAQVIYHGSYTKLDGIAMSQAYASTLNISFDVRGGLLMRQIHHWAADLFMVAILAHMLRVFFTGAYRKPREINWLIGIGLFTFGLLEGLFGYSLPDDQLSGAGLRVFEGVLQGIPVVGTYLAFFLFGGPFPGTAIVPRMYILHVLLIPGLILALITAHLFIMVLQKHTQMPGKGRTEKNVVGQPMFPYFMAKGGAWFFFIFAALALLATFAQINPIWLYGPYTPVAISSASQPDFYMGLLEGSLRIMPAWEWSFLGHTITFSVLIPFALPLTLVLGGAALWPFFEQWATGDKVDPQHQRPAPQRAHPDRDRHGGGDVLRRAVGRGGQRRHRRQPVRPAVHHHLDRAGHGVRGAVPGLRDHPADLPGRCSARTGMSWPTAMSRASSGSCPTAGSSRCTGRSMTRHGPCWRPRRYPSWCPAPATMTPAGRRGRRARTGTACPRRAPAARWAGPGASPATPSPRRFRSRRTGTGMARQRSWQRQRQRARHRERQREREREPGR